MMKADQLAFRRFQNLRDTSPADTEVAGKFCPRLRDSGVEKRLVVASRFETVGA